MPIVLLGDARSVEYKLILGRRVQLHEFNWGGQGPIMAENTLIVNFNVELRPRLSLLGINGAGMGSQSQKSPTSPPKAWQRPGRDRIALTTTKD